jgi:Family of unknown function (DUF6510)
MSVPLDGNTMAGALGELFAVDVSVAVVECAGCGHTVVVAEVVVYADAPGMVARCPACSDVLLRLVRSDRHAWLSMSGVVCLRVDI